MVKKENDFLAGKCIYSYVNNINIQIDGKQAKKKMTFQRKNAFMSMLRALGISKILKIYIHEALLRNAFSRRFQPAQQAFPCGLGVKNGERKSKWPKQKSGQSREPVPRSSFPPKPNGNDCDAGYDAFFGEFFYMLPEIEDIQVNCGF